LIRSADTLKVTDEAQRTDLYKAEQQLDKDSAIVPVYYYVNARLVKPWVGGYTGKDPMDNIYVKDCILSSINGNTWGRQPHSAYSHRIDKGTRQKVRAMLKFILRRCLEAIPTLFILITISFFMMRLAPGSPFTGERTLPPEVMANIEAKYHLNDPI
jgi:hypothetical protein